MEVEAAVITLLEKRVVEFACIETADLELVCQQELGAGQADPRAASGDNCYLAITYWVNRLGRDEERVWGGVEEHA